MQERLDELCSIERPSASPGERRAAEWLAGQLRDAGARNVRIEEESEANGAFWWPIGLLAGAGALAGLAARRGGPLKQGHRRRHGCDGGGADRRRAAAGATAVPAAAPLA